ncbi:MAG: hypothetical protein VKM34_00900 [Cyanobacteriota bacterium]|nr:hypothetical protein [Cyanobacteriota bacterium]
MTLLFLIALGWLGLRTLLLLAQVARHSPEAQLARSFEQEVTQRGLQPGDQHQGGWPGSGDL